MKAFSFLLLSTLALGSLSARAEDQAKPGSTPTAVPAVGGWSKGPCGEDVKKFCAEVNPGAGRVIDCLKAHEKQLSHSCKEKFEEKRGKKKKD